MLYEFIATLSAGFALAGIALIIRHLAKLLFKINTPKWLTPLFAAVGIFAFQIHQEYNWYNQTADTLPASTTIIKTVEKTSWYRPWSYAKPFIVRFIAVDTDNIATHEQNPNLRRVSLYLFERRVSTKQIEQVIDCQNNKRADFIVDETNFDKLDWLDIQKEDPLLIAACD